MSTHKIKADLDVDGEVQGTSLDINGAGDIAGNLVISAGALSITGDGSNAATLTESASGDFEIHANDDLRLNAGGHDIVLKGASNEFGRLTNSSQDFVIQNITSNKDIIFKGNDGGATITALTLDISAAGAATFNSGVTVGGVLTLPQADHVIADGSNILDENDNTLLSISSGVVSFSSKVQTTEIEGNSILLDSAADIELNCDGADVILKDATIGFGRFKNDSSNFVIKADISDKDMIFKVNDGGSVITALTIDASAAGKATFNNDVVAFSDRKLKDNIQTLDGKKVLDMRGVSFTRKDTGLPSSGVIAQEIQEVAPELVNETNGTLGVSYGNLVGYLIEAIKDQQKQIDELRQNCNGCSK